MWIPAGIAGVVAQWFRYDVDPEDSGGVKDMMWIPRTVGESKESEVTGNSGGQGKRYP